MTSESTVGIMRWIASALRMCRSALSHFGWPAGGIKYFLSAVEFLRTNWSSWHPTRNTDPLFARRLRAMLLLGAFPALVKSTREVKRTFSWPFSLLALDRLGSVISEQQRAINGVSARLIVAESTLRQASIAWSRDHHLVCGLGADFSKPNPLSFRGGMAFL